MKIFLSLILSLGFSFLTYLKNFKLPLFITRSLWLFLLLNIILHPVFSINVKEHYKNTIILDKSRGMNQKNKLDESKNFLKNIKGKYEILYLDEKNGNQLIREIKNKRISEILLLSDGYIPQNFKNFLENAKIPVSVFMFPGLEILENLEIKVPSFVKEKQEFLVKVNFFSEDSSEGKINIKGNGIDIKQEIKIKRGDNYLSYKLSFKNPGIKNINFLFSKGEKNVKREYKINVLKKRPEVIIFCQNPTPLLKIIKRFLKERIGEDIKIFVEISRDDIREINGFVKKLKIPERADWFIIISPDLLRDYTKIINAHKFFYFYEDTPSEKIDGKGIIEGKNFSFEPPVTEFRVAPDKIKGKEILEIKFLDRKVTLALNKGNETHFLLANSFQVFSSIEESLQNKLLDYIFETSELENPEIVYYEIPERPEEKKNFFIKAFVFTPVLKPAYNSHVLLKINKNTYPMIYQGEGIFLSPSIQMDAGKYEFEIIAKKDNFSQVSKGFIEVLPSEVKKDIDREYLSFLAKKTGGREVYEKYECKNKDVYTRKYNFDLRKNLLSYILIVLIFSIEIFLRKREGFL